ncbi:cyclin N-terminal domain-containing protein 1 isoform X2 [Melopsittacus undulatus]|uniref:cyclin N-terminal domain-containing protein 1 isoform X2 n=1 Tax=Melopsittacus undulatus TaxID=13146 RepID=UPI00146A375F|nr:cyclin N-terminal domain-containing protein 1 isoform X2 [Melopsittacus undulatus]
MGSGPQAESRYREPGPAFGRAGPEVIGDTLIRLATENEWHLRELPEGTGCFKEERIVEFIFLLAEEWRLEQPARYQAVELLERFMIKQVEQISKSSSKSVKHSEQRGGSSCSSLEDQLYNTFVLRLVSCVQLASKLSLHYNVNVSTPLAYVELLLEVLGYNGCLLPTKPLHQMCIELLDFSYLARDAIYDTLLKMAIENSTPSELQVAKFLTVKEDFMLLAVGIISTSVFVLNRGHWKQVVEHLNCITGITSQSIQDFSYAVLEQVIGSTTPRQWYRSCGTKALEHRTGPLQ